MRILNRLVPVACSVVALGLLVPVNASKRTADTPQIITPPMDVRTPRRGTSISTVPKGVRSRP